MTPAETPARLYDVAREAGVSLATASRSLNGGARMVNEAYRQRVLAAAAKLRYTPNLSAQAVVRGASSVLALLVSDIADPYFSAIAAGVIHAADAEGLLVSLAVTGRDAAREIELVRMLRGQRPRAIVLVGSRLVDDHDRATLVGELVTYERTGGRVAFISQRGLPFGTIAIDNSGAAAAMGHALVGLGYRGFAVLAGPENLVAARDRVEGFVAALPSPPLAIQHGGFSRDAGYAAMTAVIERGLGGIELVFAVNDVMAIGAMAALRDRGIDVPGRVAVAGFDGISTARDVYPPLTTVRVALEEAGAAAVALVLGEPCVAVADIPASVELRGSTPARYA
jgi:LacI family transcriptional regulator